MKNQNLKFLKRAKKATKIARKSLKNIKNNIKELPEAGNLLIAVKTLGDLSESLLSLLSDIEDRLVLIPPGSSPAATPPPAKHDRLEEIAEYLEQDNQGGSSEGVGGYGFTP